MYPQALTVQPVRSFSELRGQELCFFLHLTNIYQAPSKIYGGTCRTHTEHTVTHTTHETFTKHSQNSDIKIYTHNKQHSTHAKQSHNTYNSTHHTIYTQKTHSFIQHKHDLHTHNMHTHNTKASAEGLTSEASWQTGLVWALAFEHPWS